MIIRKPYAFLIKNFKLIHFFMLIFSTYLLYRANVIFKFFNEYVITRKVIFTGSLSIENVPNLIFIFSLLMILFSVIIYILLNQKDKPKLLYLTIILFYISFIIFSAVSRGNINTIELEGIDPKNARIIRDISLLMFLIPIGFEILLIVRTIGFDIKKFHFGEDLNSLEIDITDSEEVELTTGIDSDKLIRKLKMKAEDLKVFFFENKLIIISVLVVLLVIVPGYLIYINNINNKVYTENEDLRINDFSINVNSSYSTKYDYKGKKILNDSNNYVVVKFTITNYGSTEKGLSLNNFKLEINKNLYSANTTMYDNFIDLGNGYYDQKLNYSESKTYIAVFVVSDEDLKKDIKIRYADSLNFNDKEVTANYSRIVVKPISLDNIVKKENTSINEEVVFSDSMLKNTKLNISSYGINNKYSYTLKDSTKYIINNNGSILKLSYSFNVDSTASSISNISDFATKYWKIVYTYDNKEYETYAVDITPSDYVGNDIYLAVNENFYNAKAIKIVINVRNVIYTYVIL